MVFHRLKSCLTEVTYGDEKDELEDMASFFEAVELRVVLEILEAQLDSSGFAQIDDSFGDLIISDDFAQFVPVAFLRQASRFQGTGDFVADRPTVKLVVNFDDAGDSYELADIPTS
jgi:hypothetical protein